MGATLKLAQTLNVSLTEAQVLLRQAASNPELNTLFAFAAQNIDKATAAGDASGLTGNAGNTAGPGGLDPNDPLFRKLIQQTGEAEPIKAIARASVEGPAREGARNGVTVLGRYPAYVNTANDLRANYLNFAKGAWEKLSDVQRWAVNKQFLDDAIARGDVFRLASALKEAEPGTYFRRELDYLFSLGYEVMGDILIRIR